MSNSIIDKANPRIEQAFSIVLVFDDDAFGPHLELNTNTTSGRLSMDLETIIAVRDWCNCIIRENTNEHT